MVFYLGQRHLQKIEHASDTGVVRKGRKTAFQTSPLGEHATLLDLCIRMFVLKYVLLKPMLKDKEELLAIIQTHLIKSQYPICNAEDLVTWSKLKLENKKGQVSKGMDKRGNGIERVWNAFSVERKKLLASLQIGFGFPSFVSGLNSLTSGKRNSIFGMELVIEDNISKVEFVENYTMFKSFIKNVELFLLDCLDLLQKSFILYESEIVVNEELLSVQFYSLHEILFNMDGFITDLEKLELERDRINEEARGNMKKIEAIRTDIGTYISESEINIFFLFFKSLQLHTPNVQYRSDIFYHNITRKKRRNFISFSRLISNDLLAFIRKFVFLVLLLERSVPNSVPELASIMNNSTELPSLNEFKKSGNADWLRGLFQILLLLITLI